MRHLFQVTKIELIKACRSHPNIAQLLGIPEHLRENAREQFEQVFHGSTQRRDASNLRAISWMQANTQS